MMYSLHARNLVILHSGGRSSLHRHFAHFFVSDVYLRMMLLWACFMPLGAEWSIDKIKVGRVQPGTQLSSHDQYRNAHRPSLCLY